MLPRVLFVLPFALFALAKECKTKDVMCCNSLQDAHHIENVLESIGIIDVITNFKKKVALQCQKAATLKDGTRRCFEHQVAVCCPDDDLYGGLIRTNCDHIVLQP
ncbi:hypothetical protein BV22DRAFT_1119734 [Leucogyrophana mollusca]|uniref:Uncharacterized protein n=1 Tax=Leucogyrophana mollusca TaxID=85980 RepID=A0ACB8BH82_9AGAM|nr:hypothetical protein BV22DRAFT_1119734 [Leucogyrophana mollusca]